MSARPESEIDLVVMTRENLPMYDPRRDWLTGIWLRTSESGYLRGDIESDIAAAEWQSALKFCRESGLVSLKIQ